MKEYFANSMLKLLLGPILFVSVYVVMQYQGANAYDTIVVSTVSWMIYWWVVGVVPIMVTALLPIAILPLFNERTIHEITKLYSHPLVFLFLGGFMLAAAIEKCHLHKRIALNIIKFIGSGQPAILAGFMIATAVISMWISNTATTVLMLPIGLSVLAIMDSDPNDAKRFDVALMLGIAYSANIGGIATLIGTPPNAIFAAFLENTYGYELSFARWMIFAFPLMMFMLAICYFILIKLFGISFAKVEGDADGSGVIAQELKALGGMSKAEKLTLIVFAATAFAWMFRSPINSFLSNYIITPAEGVDISKISLLSDASIAIMASILLFCIPVSIKKKEFLMDWDTASRIPWGILLLFGGGLTAASLLAKTSLVGNLSDYISALSSGMHLIVSIVLVIALMLMMTEVMSNMALTSLLLPIVAAAAITMEQNPLLFCIPITIASSFAFMMPIATPPNAIIFSSGKITVPQMMRAGVILNTIAILMLTLVAYFVMAYAFDISFGEVPELFL